MGFMSMLVKKSSARPSGGNPNHPAPISGSSHVIVVTVVDVLVSMDGHFDPLNGQRPVLAR